MYWQRLRASRAGHPSPPATRPGASAEAPCRCWPRIPVETEGRGSRFDVPSRSKAPRAQRTQGDAVHRAVLVPNELRRPINRSASTQDSGPAARGE